jgi:hypothetical protein
MPLTSLVNLDSFTDLVEHRKWLDGKENETVTVPASVSGSGNYMSHIIIY